MDRRRSSPGFTLIELLIVVSVIALISAAAVPALGALTGAEARRGAGELAAAMRWTFDAAAVRHTTCRLVLSPAGRSWSAECAKGRAPAAPAPGTPAAPGDAKAGKDGGAPAPAFAPLASPIAGKRELPGGATFQAIRIDGRDPLAGGDESAAVHFFPGGRAQAARVVIADGGHAFTVRLEPFTGRATVAAGEPREGEE